MNVRHSLSGILRFRAKAASVALLLVAAIVAGCGASGHPSTTSSAPVQHTITGASGPASSALGHATAPVIPAGRLLRTISGTGSRAIGSLSEKTAIVLQWSTAGPAIQILTGHGFLLVDGQPGGRIRLARGDYPALKVAAHGPWTIQLRAAR